MRSCARASAPQPPLVRNLDADERLSCPLTRMPLGNVAEDTNTSRGDAWVRELFHE
jgi:hypothetical protein